MLNTYILSSKNYADNNTCMEKEARYNIGVKNR